LRQNSARANKFLIVILGIVLLLGALHIPSTFALSETYFLAASGTTCSNSNPQGGYLDYAAVPASGSFFVAPYAESCYNPYFITGEGVQNTITTNDVTVLLQLYEAGLGSGLRFGLELYDVTTNQVAFTVSFSATITSTSCSSPDGAVFDITGSPFTINSGNTFELIIFNTSDDTDFGVCFGGNAASYLTINPLETVTTTSTATTTTVSTSTSTQTLTSTATATITTSVTATTIVTTTQTQLVPTTTTVKCAPSAPAEGSPTTCTATVKSADDSKLPGIVQFSSSGAGSFGTVSCKANSKGTICTVAYTPSARGHQTIQGTYPGDQYHSGSAGLFNLRVAAEPLRSFPPSNLIAAPKQNAVPPASFAIPAIGSALVSILLFLVLPVFGAWAYLGRNLQGLDNSHKNHFSAPGGGIV
jgi:hypothetical protein